MPPIRSYLAILACGLLAVTSARAQYGASDGNWQAYAADKGATKYTGLSQIDASNINSLQVVWRRSALDDYYLGLNPEQRVTPTYISAPVVAGGRAFIPNGIGLVEAFDPGTGETLWVQEPIGGVDGLRGGTATRGVAYWSEGNESRVLVQRGLYLLFQNGRGV